MSIPGYDAWKLQSPPYLDGYPDEAPCDGCARDLDDTAIKVKRAGYEYFYCSDCATTVERCDQCQCVRCGCES